MNNKSLLTTTLLAALTLSGFESNAASANTPPPARVPGLDLVKEEPRTSTNKSDKLEEDLTDGLVAHYPFSGDANDQSGNENHLSVQGASLSTDRFGMTESAYSFDGKDDYLFADLDDRKGDFSLSLWAKANDVEQSRFRSVINIHDKTPGSAATCQIHTSGGRYPSYQFFSSNPESFALVTTEWQHLAVTVSGKVVRFYENGKRVYSQELEGGAANQFSNIIIGQNRNRDRKYDGSIDDVYVYNRAINDAEVARLFNGGFEDTDGDGLTNDYETGKGRYILVKGEYDWKTAKEHAELQGGHLATITSQKEWEAVKAWAGDLPSTYWLGGTDEKTEGVWEWITKEAWSFTKWAKNEPNNLGNEDYLQTWGPSLDGNRAWNDNQFNENKNGYILEFGYFTDPTNPDSDGDGHDDGKEVAANTDPNNPFSRPMPNILAPEAGPGAPPAPDYLVTIAQKSEEIRKQADELKQANDEIATQAIQIGELTSENAKLQGEVKSLNGKVTGLETEVVALKTDNEGLKGQIQNLREDNQNIRYELTSTTEHLEEAIQVAETPFINGWVYDPARGWIFTDAEHFPLVYTHNDQSWNYYELGSSDPRYFYNYTTQEWVAWDAQPEETEQTVASNSNF
jgi:FtsZ-binding cell division protein ZapB